MSRTILATLFAALISGCAPDGCTSDNISSCHSACNGRMATYDKGRCDCVGLDGGAS